MVKISLHILVFLLIFLSVKSSAQIITTFAGNKQDAFTPDGDQVKTSGINVTTSIRMGPDGYLYLIDHYRIRKIDTTTRIITTVAGNGEIGFSGDGGPALNASLYYPLDFYIDSEGNIYICDSWNNRIRKVDGRTRIITTIAGNGTTTYQDSVQALSSGLNRPTSVTMDNNHNLYIVSSDYTRYSGYNYIYKLNLSSGLIIKIAGNGTGVYAGDGTPALQTGFYTTGICADAGGNIYLADPVHNSILKLDASTGIIHTIAGTGTVSGLGYSGDGGAAYKAKMNQPVNICFDADSNLLVVDEGNNLIRRINRISGIITTVAGLQVQDSFSVGGIYGYSGDGGPATCAKLHLYNGHSSPAGITSDLAGNFYFSDQGNQVVRMVDNSVIRAVDPGFNIEASATRICPGQPVIVKSAIFYAGDTVVNPPVYQWIKNGEPIDVNGATYASNKWRDNDNIYCKLKTANNLCQTVTVLSNRITFSLTSPIVPTVSLSPGDTAICPGEPVTFKVELLQGGDSTIYQWQINGHTAAGNENFFTYKNIKAGDRVNCIVKTNSPNCPVMQTIFSDTANIHFKSLPNINLLPGDTIIKPGASVQLNAVSEDPLLSWQWMPGSGLNNTSLLNPVAAPQQTTRYYFNAKSKDGCEIEKSLQIILAIPLYMPTAFTPNGDGQNDLFRIPQGAVFHLKEFSVYDRWGKIVFTTQKITTGWDGNYKGMKSPTGTYVYFITGEMDNKPIRVKGTVTLIR